MALNTSTITHIGTESVTTSAHVGRFASILHGEEPLPYNIVKIDATGQTDHNAIGPIDYRKGVPLSSFA